jgi:hypothetical protein
LDSIQIHFCPAAWTLFALPVRFQISFRPWEQKTVSVTDTILNGPRRQQCNNVLVGAIVQALQSIHFLLEAESLFRKIAPFSRNQPLQCKPFRCVDLVSKISEKKA